MNIIMTSTLIRSEYCINSFRYTDEFKQTKYFTSISDNNTIQNIFQILCSLNAHIDLNDFILLSFFKTKNNLNLTHLEFFKQMLQNKYYKCISSNELLKFNLISKPKHLKKILEKKYRIHKDYSIVGEYIFYIVPDIFKDLLASSKKHKDLYLTYIHLEEFMYFYDQLQKTILSNTIILYKNRTNMLEHDHHRMETELRNYVLADSINDSNDIEVDSSDSYEERYEEIYKEPSPLSSSFKTTRVCIDLGILPARSKSARELVI